MINSRKPISPLDCFYSPEKDFNQKYIAFNLFDYTFFSEKGYDVIYEKIGMEEVFEEWDLLIKNKGENSVQIKTSKAAYELDLKAFYCYKSQGVGYGELIRMLIEKRCGVTVEVRDFSKKHSKSNYWLRVRKLLIALKEFITNHGFLAEEHSSLNVTESSSKLFNNVIFNFLFRKKIKETLNTLWQENKDYLENNSKRYKYDLKKLIQSLLYLDYKTYKKIQISNFTGASQQAALVYATAHNAEIEIVQHGRWMVHHLPSPLYKAFYKDRNIVLWEEEFLEKAGGNPNQLSKRPKSRIELDGKQKENYILIGTSAPMLLDLDIYFQFWKALSSIIKNTDENFKIKLHRADVLTKSFINFFQLNHIEIIPKIKNIPKKVIVLNTTFTYEFAGYADVFDFKHNTAHESLKKFINSE